MTYQTDSAHILPMPCKVFYAGKSDNEICEVAVEKIGEEYIEIQEAVFGFKHNATQKAKDHLAEELTDIITAATSALDALGYNEKARALLQTRINEKNFRRGYHSIGTE